MFGHCASPGMANLAALFFLMALGRGGNETIITGKGKAEIFGLGSMGLRLCTSKIKTFTSFQS